MSYQTRDNERGDSLYDPVIDSDQKQLSGRPLLWRQLWVTLVICVVVGLTGHVLSQARLPSQSLVDFDASRFMPTNNLMACLQSSCNTALAAMAMKYDDTEGQEIMKCLNMAADDVSGRACFDKLSSQSSSEAVTMYVCAICKHCIPGDVSPTRCTTLPQSYNDLRGSPVATGPSNDQKLKNPDEIPGTEVQWMHFLEKSQVEDIRAEPKQIPTINLAVATDHIPGTDYPWAKVLSGVGKGELHTMKVHSGDPLEYVPSNFVDASAVKPVDDTSLLEQKRRLNACIQMNCNSAMAALGSGIAANPQTEQLARCIQDSETQEAATKCFKQYPCPQGDTLKTCMLCKHCLSGSVDPNKCLALERNPNDIRGP